jgi:hypothetical protein
VVLYVVSVALPVLGLVVLVAALLRVRRAVRGLTGAAAAAGYRVSDASGLLRARSAALGIAIRQRRRVRIESDLARVPSGEPAQTGGRPWAISDRGKF